MCLETADMHRNNQPSKNDDARPLMLYPFLFLLFQKTNKEELNESSSDIHSNQQIEE